MPTPKQEFLDSIREQVFTYAHNRAGVFMPHELTALGIDTGITKTMVRSRRWRKLRYGVYTDRLTLDQATGSPDKLHELNLAAAIVSLRGPAAAFGRSAALLHSLPLPDGKPHQLELVRNAGADLRALNDRVRNSHALPDVHTRTHNFELIDLEVLRGVPTVSRPWAAVTAACRLPRNYQVGLLDSVLWESGSTHAELDAICEKTINVRGTREVRRVIPLARDGAQTILETISCLTFNDHDLPEPTLQEKIYDSHGLVGIADFAWISLGIIGEADGAIKYTDAASLIEERRREQRIKDAGFEIFRWTWREIHNDPRRVVARFTRAVHSSRRAA